MSDAPTGTRNRMVNGAVDLIRRRGVNATSVREVVRHTETPRGSIAHHFPRGKLQLVEEALACAGQEVSGPLEQLVAENGAVAGLRAFIGLWRQVLVATHFEAGCPVLAIAVEQYIGEDGNPNLAAQKRLLAQVNGIFGQWRHLLETAMQRDGIAAEHARRLSTLVIASVEGTVAMCRAARSAQPLDDVLQELEFVITAATRPGSKPRGKSN